MNPLCQGDVSLFPVESIPEDLKSVKREGGRIVLREGEVTGHAHVIDAPGAEMFVQDDLNEMADRFLRVETEVELTHEEHGTIVVPPGDYIVRGQREYDPFAQTAMMVGD